VRKPLRVSLALLTLLAGCTKGCGHDRPHAPYAIEAGAALSGSDGTADAGAAVATTDQRDAGRSPLLVAEKAPLPASGSWDLQGLRLVAPEGENFVLGLATDLDGDGARDAAAWTAAGEGAAGKLWFFRGTVDPQNPAPARLIAALPPLLQDGPGCTVERVLQQIGAHTVSVRVGSSCPSRPQLGTKVAWIAVAALTSDPPLRQQITVGATREGEQFAVDVDAADADGDGRDDLLVTAALEGGAPPFAPGPRVTADLRWFDRPAGLSRDPGEPEASLRKAASTELHRAAKKNEAPLVGPAIRQMAALYEGLCSESSDRVVTFSSGPLRCGPSRALEEAGAAEVKAALTRGLVLEAIGASERIGWRFATTTPQRRAEIDKWIVARAPVVNPASVRTLRAVPASARAPSWGP